MYLGYDRLFSVLTVHLSKVSGPLDGGGKKNQLFRELLNIPYEE